MLRGNDPYDPEGGQFSIELSVAYAEAGEDLDKIGSYAGASAFHLYNLDNDFDAAIEHLQAFVDS